MFPSVNCWILQLQPWWITRRQQSSACFPVCQHKIWRRWRPFSRCPEGRWFERLLCLGKKVDLAQHLCPFQSISYDWKKCRYDVVPRRTIQRRNIWRAAVPTVAGFFGCGTSAGCCTERLYGLPLLSTIIAGAPKKATEKWLTILGIFVRMMFLLKFEAIHNDPQNWWLEYVGIWMTWSQVSYVEVV